MSTEDLTRWQSCNEQDFEINLTIQDNIYHYTLVVEHDRDCRRMRIAKERLTHNDKPIFDSTDSNAQLYHDDYTEGPMYRFDWSRSGVDVLDLIYLSPGQGALFLDEPDNYLALREIHL